MSGTKFFLLVCLVLIIGILIGLGLRTSRFFKSELLEFEGQVIEIEGEVVKQEENKFVLEVKKENVLIFSSQIFDFLDKLKVVGKIEKPPVFDDFDYKEYLKRKKIFALIYQPEIEKISEKKLSIYKGVLHLRKNLAEAIDKSYPTEQASILKAMVLGIKTEISDSLKDKLNRAGIRHLTAISGMHTVILINALMFLFVGLGLWRKQAFFLTLLFILFFVMLTGFQASTIRASIMAVLLLLAQVVGRMSNATRAIVLTGLIMLLLNPYLLFDVGFQLSFLAVMGINYLFPVFRFWFRKFPKTLGLKNILIMTLSAQIFTLPILIYNFGYVSLIAPLANLFILPFLPFILIFGAMSAIVALFSHPLALIFIFSCYILLSYLLKITNVFSSFAFSSIHLSFPWVFIIIFYSLLFYSIHNWRKEHRFKILSF